MRNILIIISLLTLFDKSFGQTDTIKYKQFDDSSEFSELNLNPDKSFQFNHYNMRSCWTWYSVQGIWKIEDNKMVFTDTIHWQEDILSIDTTIKNTDFVLITVKNDKGRPLEGIKVKYNHFWTDNGNTYVTDKNGEIKISKQTIKKQKNEKYGSVEFAIQFHNEKSSECSMSTSFEPSFDKINITVIDNPKEEDIIRTTIYRIDCNELYFLNQKYTGDKGYWQQNWGSFRTADNE